MKLEGEREEEKEEGEGRDREKEICHVHKSVKSGRSVIFPCSKRKKLPLLRYPRPHFVFSYAIIRHNVVEPVCQLSSDEVGLYPHCTIITLHQ